MGILSVDHLSKQFGKKTALYNISFDLNHGVLGLLGPNGAGKTTLLRCISGIMKPDRGSIRKPEFIGYLPQRFGAYNSLNVQEILEYYAALKKIPRTEQDAAIESALIAVNLIEERHKRVGSLSGGMTRRLGIAQAILGDPPLLLFDEPTTGLDPDERIRFHSLLSQLKLKNILVIISTHIVEDISNVCENVILLHEGRIVRNNTVAEIIEEANGKVFLVPASLQHELTEPYSFIRNEFIEGEVYMRVISSNQQPGIAHAPTLEDSYFCIIHGIE